MTDNKGLCQLAWIFGSDAIGWGKRALLANKKINFCMVALFLKC